MQLQCIFNPLLYDKILDWSKFKAFVDDKVNVIVKNWNIFQY